MDNLDLTIKREPFDLLGEWKNLVRLQDGSIILMIENKIYLVKDLQE